MTTQDEQTVRYRCCVVEVYRLDRYDNSRISEWIDFDVVEVYRLDRYDNHQVFSAEQW